MHSYKKQLIIKWNEHILNLYNSTEIMGNEEDQDENILHLDDIKYQKKFLRKKKKILRVRDTSLHQPRENVRAEVSLTVTVTLFLGG